jgi:hypothetical protein
MPDTHSLEPWTRPITLAASDQFISQPGLQPTSLLAAAQAPCAGMVGTHEQSIAWAFQTAMGYGFHV